MAGLKEVRIRIASVKSTRQITNAMKMVAASKLRRAQNSILKLRPYAAKLKEILQNLSAATDIGGENVYAEQRNPERILLIVIASNRGLCGAFNSNVIKKALEQIHSVYAAQHQKNQVKLITIGRRVSEFFMKRKYQVLESHDDFFDQLTFPNVSTLSTKLMQRFVTKEFDRIEIIYNQFKNAATQRLIVERFLPVEPVAAQVEEKRQGASKADYLYEPDLETLVRELIPKTLKIQIYKSVLDSYAAEMGARMTAMQQATDNAQELLKSLNISYNKARQNAITNELIEIVSGAEALKG